MSKIRLWLLIERGLASLFGKTEQWPPGYWLFVLRGNRASLRIFTHLTKAEKLLLYTLALDLPKNNCMVELGSYLGASSCFLAAAAKETGGRLFCVDTWRNEGMTEGPRDTYEEFLNNTHRYRDLIVPIRARTQEAAVHFDRMIDLLFIDADHRYEAVIADLHSWLPKLHPGG
jgi:predicted O-methyltransferase YrrM